MRISSPGASSARISLSLACASSTVMLADIFPPLASRPHSIRLGTAGFLLCLSVSGACPGHGRLRPLLLLRADFLVVRVGLGPYPFQCFLQKMGRELHRADLALGR